MQKISSPCVMICRLNAAGECIGCGRTREQIARWLHYSETERKAIMKELVPPYQRTPTK